MAEERVTPQEFISGKLRGNITDPNATARASAGLSVNWIYPDRPLIKNLSANENNFPRISVTRLDIGSQGDIGIGGTETYDDVNLLINVWTIREKAQTVVSTSDESKTFLIGTDIYNLNNLPVSSISSVTGTLSSAAHTFVKGTDYQLVDDDGDGRFDSIDWSLGGDDPDNNTAILVTYVRSLSGYALAEYLAQSAHIYLRDNWRTDIAPTLFDYVRTREPAFIEEMDGRIERVEIQVKFDGINIGD